MKFVCEHHIPKVGAPGKVVDLKDNEDTARLLRLGAIRPHDGRLPDPEEAPPASQISDDQMEALVKAISELDLSNDSQLTGEGKPRTEILENIVGHSVSADARDAAWDLFNAQ